MTDLECPECDGSGICPACVGDCCDECSESGECADCAGTGLCSS